MTTIERRAVLVRLLADIDQRIALAKTLSDSPFLTGDEQRYAAAELKFQIQSATRVEAMLARGH